MEEAENKIKPIAIAPLVRGFRNGLPEGTRVSKEVGEVLRDIVQKVLFLVGRYSALILEAQRKKTVTRDVIEEAFRAVLGSTG